MASKMTQYLKKYSCVRLSLSTVRKPRNIAIEHNLHDSDRTSRYRDIRRKALIYHFWKQFCQVLYILSRRVTSLNPPSLTQIQPLIAVLGPISLVIIR